MPVQRINVTDIGGRGFGADANDVHEEGLYIPIMKFTHAGKVDTTLLTIIRGNVREPDQLVGDIFAHLQWQVMQPMS